MACLFENRKFIENAVRHVQSTLNVSGPQGFASDDEVVVEDGFSNNSAENNTKIFISGSYIGIFKEDLITVTAIERITLTTVMSLLLIISVCGNICSLRANMRRQLRPFFRACLISLAISDLINTTFLTTAYLSQILQEYSQVWILGRGMCHVVPSITTAAILVSSITLVGIAMDRYFAVMRAVISFWNPGVIFCVLSMLALWAAAIGTSWPVFGVYELYPVHILTRQWIAIPNTNSSTIASAGSATVTTATTATESRTTMPTLYETSAETVTKSPWEQQTANNNQSYAMLMTSELVMMCISNQSSIAKYYFAIFGIIFVPTIIAFIWMNSVIAKQLWKSRRTAASVSKRQHKSWWRHLPYICSRKCKDDERNLKEYPVDSRGRPSNCLTISNGVGINTADNKIPLPIQPSVTSIIFPTNVSSAVAPKTSNSNNREARHLRMFTVIILLITAFLFLRSPTWILMLMRIGGVYTGRFPIILHYFFGILNLTNSMLNPFFYTFLTDVLKFAHFIKVTFCCGFCNFRLRHQSKQHVATYPTANSAGLGEDGSASLIASTSTCCGSFWINKTDALTRSLCCKPAARKSSGVTKLRIQPLDDKLKGDSESHGNERDEGVDCSDASCYSKDENETVNSAQ
ncbi:uncharacterized protein LOC126755285 [Bactrocera neohumeralis]|uniref:uncharacterized protein LOC126755285 n=1 Tax=Bactrocera neohumeralis TaxID=98809 RepID=UPI002166B04C|nr:uncharacterized protein LOC126755285 [Bactrocera neohumeralis]